MAITSGWFKICKHGQRCSMKSELMSVLIGDIYDAALNPALWVDVLGKTRAFIGGCAIALSWKDAVAKRGGSDL